MVSKSTVVATAWLDSPIGGIRLEASTLGLSRVQVASPPGDSRGTSVNAILQEAVDELRAFFAGRPRPTAVALDLGEATPFVRKVWMTLAGTVPGELLTYGDLAARVGRPGAARAIGTAMARNPIPILIPCHRVIASGGRPGGYGHGLEMKSRLLSFEGAVLPGHSSFTSSR